MKVAKSVPTIFTSMPPSFTSSTSQVTTAPFLTSPGSAEGIAFELLDAERDALLFDIDVEHHGLDHVALLEVVDHLLARLLPVEVGEMDHAVDVAFEAEEQTELGLVLDFAFDGRTDRELLDEALPRVAPCVCLRPSEIRRLTESTSSTCTSTSCEVETILPGCMFFLVQRHLGDVDQAFDARLELDERTVVGDVGDAAGEARADRILRLDALPRIVSAAASCRARCGASRG